MYFQPDITLQREGRCKNNHSQEMYMLTQLLFIINNAKFPYTMPKPGGTEIFLSFCEAVGKRLSEMIPIRHSHSIVKKRGWYKSWLTGFSLFLRSQLYRNLVLYGIAYMVSGSRVIGNALLWNSNFFWNVRWEETGCILTYHFTSWKKKQYFSLGDTSLKLYCHSVGKIA